jgi:hypothetical protein
VVIFESHLVADGLNQYQVLLGDHLHRADGILQERVLTEKGGRTNVIGQTVHLVKDFTGRIVKIDVAKLTIDALKHERDAIKLVVLDHHGVGLADVALASEDTLLFTVETSYGGASSIDTVVRIQEFSDSG